jgi:hypothetical protein
MEKEHTMKTFATVVIVLVLAVFALLAAGCERPSYVDSVDRQTAHQYAISAQAVNGFIQTLNPPTDEDGRMVVLTTAQWSVIRAAWALDTMRWLAVDDWARQFGSGKKPSAEVIGWAKSLVPQD